MKKLIFIDNDNKDKVLKNLNMINTLLEDIGKLSKSYLSTMDYITGFHTLEREEVYKILFDNKNCIISLSSYTISPDNSLGQLLSFLKSAGRNDIKDVIYVDIGGYIYNTLRNNITYEEKMYWLY